MDKLKLYTHEEMLDAVVGVKGTPRRDKYEADINNFLIGEAIKKARTAWRTYGSKKSPDFKNRKWEKRDFLYDS